MYLITGASGFIGVRLVNALQCHSTSMRLLSRNKIPGYETVVCDLQSESIPDNVAILQITFHSIPYGFSLFVITLSPLF